MIYICILEQEKVLAIIFSCMFPNMWNKYTIKKIRIT